jgi:hypothetical protein
VGAFNDRCMLTGACLHDVTAVLLREQPDGSYRPCALSVEGAWDGAGGVKVSQAAAHLRHLATGLTESFHAGRLQVNFAACFREPFAPGDDAETTFRKLVSAAEMDSRDGGREVQLSGARLRVAMLATPVARALAGSSEDAAHAPEPARLLDWEGGGQALYAGHADLAHDPAVRTLAALEAALDHRKVTWAPAGPTATQFSDQAERRALQAAVARFIDDLPVRQALLRHAHQHHFSELTIDQILQADWLEWE